MWKSRRSNAPSTRPLVPEGLRIYAVGDVHGRADLLKQLFSRIDEDLKDHPHFADSTPQRLTRVILRDGIFSDSDELSQMYDRPVHAYRRLYQLSGLEPFVEAVMTQFLIPHAMAQANPRQILAMIGPRSSGRRRCRSPRTPGRHGGNQQSWRLRYAFSHILSMLVPSIARTPGSKSQ